MKKLLSLITIVFLLNSCDDGPRTVFLQDEPYMIITCTEFNSFGREYPKYSYHVRDARGEIVFYLDEKLNVGDTLYIGKKLQNLEQLNIGDTLHLNKNE